MAARVTQGREMLGSGFSYPVERFRTRLLSKLRLPKPRKGATALELGCGDGIVSSWLAAQGWKVLSLDVEEHANWKRLAARHKGRLKFVKGDAAELRGITSRFDLVFEKDMLHHVDDPVRVLGRMKARLKPGGLLAVLEANRYNPVFYLHLTLMGNHQHFTPGRLRRHLEAAGLQGATHEVFESRVWPFNAPAFQNLVDGIQDFTERLAFLHPVLCYNFFKWRGGK